MGEDADATVHIVSGDEVCIMWEKGMIARKGVSEERRERRRRDRSRFKADRSLETRYAMKVMGSLLGNVKRNLTETDRWKDTFKLGTTGPRGTLFLSDGEDVTELYKVRPSNSKKKKTNKKQKITADKNKYNNQKQIQKTITTTKNNYSSQKHTCKT